MADECKATFPRASTLLYIEDVARLLEITPAAVRKLVQRGDLHYATGGKTIATETVAALLRERRDKGLER